MGYSSALSAIFADRHIKREMDGSKGKYIRQKENTYIKSEIGTSQIRNMYTYTHTW